MLLFLTSTETIRTFASYDGMHGAWPDYFKTYYKRRSDKNIAIRAIHPDTPMARERIRRNKEELRESALIPADKFYFDPEIQLYDNKINIASWKEKMGIIIESEEIFKTLVVAFDLSWAQAKILEQGK